VRARVSRPDSLGGRAVCAGGPDGHAVCRRSGSNSKAVHPLGHVDDRHAQGCCSGKGSVRAPRGGGGE
jgi:hypothetical protein